MWTRELCMATLPPLANCIHVDWCGSFFGVYARRGTAEFIINSGRKGGNCASFFPLSFVNEFIKIDHLRLCWLDFQEVLGNYVREYFYENFEFEVFTAQEHKILIKRFELTLFFTTPIQLRVKMRYTRYVLANMAPKASEKAVDSK